MKSRPGEEEEMNINEYSNILSIHNLETLIEPYSKLDDLGRVVTKPSHTPPQSPLNDKKKMALELLPHTIVQVSTKNKMVSDLFGSGKTILLLFLPQSIMKSWQWYGSKENIYL